MIAHVWDELSEQWGEWELDLPEDCRDPQAINLAIGQAVADGGPTPLVWGVPSTSSDEDGGDGWEVRSHSFTGPILTIEARSDRNHLCIIVVNYEQ